MTGIDTSEWFEKIIKRIKANGAKKAGSTANSMENAKEVVMQDPTGFKGRRKINISLFKIAIVIIGIIFLIIYYDQSKNRRYSVFDKKGYAIIDNRTGILYFGDKGDDTVEQTVVLDQVKGTIRYVPLKRLP